MNEEEKQKRQKKYSTRQKYENTCIICWNCGYFNRNKSEICIKCGCNIE